MKKHILLSTCIATAVVSTLFHSCSPDSNPKISNGTNAQIVGASAQDILNGNKELDIEIQYMPGAQPNATTVANLKQALTSITNKSVINITQTAVTSFNGTKMSVDDLLSYEQQNRKLFTDKDKIAVYVLFANANSTEDTPSGQVLGVAYRNTSIGIYQKTIQSSSGGLLQPSRVKTESTVLEHEFGHLLGLVDLGSPMQENHKDLSHGNHCSVTSCLMYYAVDNSIGLKNLLDNNIPSLDAYCAADLKANGGK